MRYQIGIPETHMIWTVVEADSPSEAVKEAKRQYDAGLLESSNDITIAPDCDWYWSEIGPPPWEKENT